MYGDEVASMHVAFGADSFDASTPSIRWKRCCHGVASYLAPRRVKLSGLVFVALMVEDVVMGVRPHAVADVADPESMLGLVLVLAGLAIRSWAAGILQKSREVTTAGPYQLIRNPLYVGSFLIMVGFATIIDDAENIFFILGPVVVLYFFQVLYEERSLAKAFGAQWHEYASRTPRFVPKRLPREPFAAWLKSTWLRNREYRALLSVLTGLAAIEAWRAIHAG